MIEKYFMFRFFLEVIGTALGIAFMIFYIWWKFRK